MLGSAGDELRPVTVLFADIVGSTALGERLAPEEVKALVGECVTAMSRAVEEYGGTIQAYQGDGICAYFGVPAAHEDDPERAARAALRILEVVGEYGRDIAGAWGIADFNVRIGINSGQTAVGFVGAGDPQAVALGDTTNVAARLQGEARPGTITVGEAIARHLSNQFVFEPLGELALKGRTEPVSVFRLVRSQTEERPSAPPRLVGRAPEVERLRTAVEDLRAGRGQVVVLLGEPGIGKTRLLTEVRSIAGDEITWLEGHCLSYGGLPSWPFIEILRRWLGVESGEAEVAVRTKARAKLGAVLGSDFDDVLPSLGRLLRIRLDPEVEDRLRGQTIAIAEAVHRAYAAWIEALTDRGPVVLALEDVHWAHSSTREFAETLLEVTDRAPLLVLTTMRREPASEGWQLRLRILADFPHRATELALGPLSEEAAAELLAEHLPGSLDDETRNQLIERAEGNPLYLEELLWALVETGGVRERRRTWTITLSPAELPSALESLLIARIDRLPDGPRRLVQAAAAIGRTFSLPVLERASASEDVPRDLAVLLRAEIVRELRRYPELECTFKHGLLQEAALSTLTPVGRRELYGRIAAAFEEVSGGFLDDLERLAHYYAQSEDLPRALECLEQAGAQAADLGAEERALDLRRRAQTIAARIGEALGKPGA
ncbi:MAG: AAA family ATPase [Gaiellaceae bacterium]